MCSELDGVVVWVVWWGWVLMFLLGVLIRVGDLEYLVVILWVGRWIIKLKILELVYYVCNDLGVGIFGWLVVSCFLIEWSEDYSIWKVNYVWFD